MRMHTMFTPYLSATWLFDSLVYFVSYNVENCTNLHYIVIIRFQYMLIYLYKCVVVHLISYFIFMLATCYSYMNPPLRIYIIFESGIFIRNWTKLNEVVVCLLLKDGTTKNVEFPNAIVCTMIIYSSITYLICICVWR